MDTEEQRFEHHHSQPDSARPADVAGVDTPLISQAFKQRLELLTHLISNSNRLPVVNGVHGSGKSTLLQQLHKSAPMDWRVCHVPATPMLQSGGLFKALSECYSLPQRRLENPHQLLRRFEDLNQAGNLPVLLVDDAEQLSVDTLVNLLTLFNQLSDAGVRFSVVLFASPPIEVLLSQAGERLGTDPALLLPLQPLDFEQTRQLAQHMWRSLAPEKELLEASDLERVFEASLGLPSGIREQVSLLSGLHVSSGKGRPSKRIKLPQLFTDVSAPALVGGVILAILILLTLVYEDEINALFEGGSDTAMRMNEPSPSGASIPIAIPKQPRLSEVAGAGAPIAGVATGADSIERMMPEKVDATNSEAADLLPVNRLPPRVELPLVVNEPEPAAAAPGKPDPVANEKPAIPPEITSPGKLPTERIAPMPEKPEVAADGPAAPRQNGTDSASDTLSTAAPVVAREVDTSKQDGSRPLQAVSVDVVKAPIAESPAPIVERSSSPTAAPAVAPAPESVAVVANRTAKPKPAPVAARIPFRTEQWLKRQPAARYTLQLLALSTEEAAINYLKRHRLQDKAAFFRMERKGKPLYPILYGVYDSRDAASAARDKLPRELNRSAAWPRSFGSVHELIR
jgi:DamX protein